MEEDKKDWLKPTEVLQYDEELGKQCLEDPNNDWSEKLEDGIGTENDAEPQG